MQCETRFNNNPGGIYSAGEVVTGTVAINLESPIYVKGVALKIAGYAKTQWKKDKPKKDKPNKNGNKVEKDEHFEGREDYISSINYLVGSENAVSVTIPAGNNTYNFSCQIPSSCPTSLESPLGHIRYLVRVVFICPPKDDQIYTVGFTVFNSVNLNLDYPSLSIPTGMDGMRNFFCRSGQLLLSANIPKTGYAPGEIVHITAKLENFAGVRFQKISYFLQKIVLYTCLAPKMRTKTTKICLEEKQQTISGTISRTETESLQIPQIAPTSQSGCKIIKISYEIEVEVQVTRKRTLSVSIPIVIGTIGLAHSNQYCAAGQRASRIEIPIANYSNALPIINSGEASVAAVGSDIVLNDLAFASAPYMKAVDLNTEKHSQAKGMFSPKYPVFNNDLLYNNENSNPWSE